MAQCLKCKAENPTENVRCWKCQKKEWNPEAQAEAKASFAASGLKNYQKDVEKARRDRNK